MAGESNMLAGQPVILLREGTEQAKGVDAQKEILRAARAIAESLRSTLGPRGRDKMMVDSLGDVVITNDGATILKQMEVQHPAGKMVAEVAKTQDQECGDGTKRSVILTGEFLLKAEDLLDEKVHPTLIVQGFQIATEKALEYLEKLGLPVARADVDLLRTIAMTSMISKGVSSYRDFLATLAVRAVTEVMDERDGTLHFDKKNIQLVKRQGGEIHDSELLDGHIVEQKAIHPDMPKWIDRARIAIFEAPIEVKKTEFSAEIKITEVGQMESFLKEEQKMIQSMVDAIVRSGANVVFTEKGIDEVAAEHLAKAGVYAVRQVKHTDVGLLTGQRGRVSSPAPSTSARPTLGWPPESKNASLERIVSHSLPVAHMLRPSRCSFGAVLQHVVDEVERSLNDAISTVGIALEDGKVVTGAGATAIELSGRLREFAMTVGGREQMAVEAYASALEVIPATLAENAGMDIIDTLIELRRRHKTGDQNAGVNALAARVDYMGLIAVEPLRVDRQVLLGATEAATMLLRIDDVISSGRTAAASPKNPPGPSAFE